MPNINLINSNETPPIDKALTLLKQALVDEMISAEEARILFENFTPEEVTTIIDRLYERSRSVAITLSSKLINENVAERLLESEDYENAIRTCDRVISNNIDEIRQAMKDNNHFSDRDLRYYSSSIHHIKDLLERELLLDRIYLIKDRYGLSLDDINKISEALRMDHPHHAVLLLREFISHYNEGGSNKLPPAIGKLLNIQTVSRIRDIPSAAITALLNN